MITKFFIFFLTVITSIIFYRFLINYGDLNVRDYHLQPPPSLTGILEENNLLSGGDWLLKGQLLGPESIVIDDDIIYTGTLDGKIVKIRNGIIEDEIKINKLAKNCNGENVYECGRPLGIRKLNKDELITVDPVNGVYIVNFNKKTLKLVFDINKKINNKKATLLDDLTIYNEKEIFVTDASTKYGYNDFHKVIFEHQPRGRVLKINIETGEGTEVTTGYYFPNGIQMHPDGDSFVVCDFTSANIWRYYVNGPKKNEAKLFIDNLPGMPDNIRLSKSGKSFYVALGAKRSQEKPSIFDFLNNGFLARSIRSILASNIPPWVFVKIESVLPHPGTLFLELDLNGNIIKSYHDNNGLTLPRITEVAEDDKYFYFGSFIDDYLVRIPKRESPIE
ncbi:Six-bladed beta-propeller, TolB-like domain and Strictosidine synthase, conserved region domain-containing protein [Strongyloides ratti]|uniref:Six-bladed beta-propeller, TolB-like domain and Strictosidine synthase, conserved region domain-containing protein n=1 Tax=Strongyloides ratti TaxID=34506 RepID=A0A090L008_STRRB|nr:Six-bladed beta-propeller, TolB-like domain and Strictosidine synthase, conserved region domain-containing protein [Strongyloides ratti]CEF60794.1 Six-bladed beta-propeller, TolB-like domain and Strictosidine synthase, conserved region domain-containing protein [Strongyloides ratti]